MHPQSLFLSSLCSPAAVYYDPFKSQLRVRALWDPASSQRDPVLTWEYKGLQTGKRIANSWPNLGVQGHAESSLITQPDTLLGRPWKSHFDGVPSHV